jgi:hypothetical protein
VADMLRKFFIQLAIYGEFLLAGLPENTKNFFLFVPKLKLAHQPEAIVALLNIISIHPSKIALSKTEIVDPIQ